jgi:hypothetical protein
MFGGGKNQSNVPLFIGEGGVQQNSPASTAAGVNPSGAHTPRKFEKRMFPHNSNKNSTKENFLQTPLPGGGDGIIRHLHL